MSQLSQLKSKILELVREYSHQAHASFRPASDPQRIPFVPGSSSIPYAGRVFTANASFAP